MKLDFCFRCKEKEKKGNYGYFAQFEFPFWIKDGEEAYIAHIFMCAKCLEKLSTYTDLSNWIEENKDYVYELLSNQDINDEDRIFYVTRYDNVDELNTKIDEMKKTIYDLEIKERNAKNKLNKYIENNKVNMLEKITSSVYLCKNFANSLIKIGFTTNEPQKRERTLQSEEPQLEFIRVFKGTLKDEQYLHNLYDKKRKRGEWFKLDDSDIKEIYNYFNDKYVTYRKNEV